MLLSPRPLTLYRTCIRTLPEPTVCITRAATRFMSSSLAHPSWDPTSARYPPARRDEASEHVYKSAKHGEVTVKDPYVWLETPPSESAETKEWVDKQVELFSQYVEKAEDIEKFKESLTRVWNYRKFSAPSLQEDGRYYWNENTGLQPQSALWRSKGKQLTFDKDGKLEGEVFFDPNALSKDGTVSLANMSFSKQGNYFGYGISKSGSDWTTIYVRPTSAPFPPKEGVSHNEDTTRLGEELNFIKFSSIGWTADEKGFFYQRYPEQIAPSGAAGTETKSNENAKLYYHRIGTPQEQDVLIIEDPEHPQYMWGSAATKDGRWVMVTVSKDTSRSNLLWLADLHAPANKEIGPNMKWIKVVNQWGPEFGPICNDDALFYVLTNEGANNYKIVTLDVSDPEKPVWKEHIPEDPEAFLADVHPTNKDKFAIVYSRDVKDELYLYDMKTGKKITRLVDDFVGSIGQISGRREHPEFFVSFSNFITPGAIYHYDFARPAGQEIGLFRKTVVSGLDAKDFTSEQVFYTSKDGTRIPMFITRHKDTPRDGTAPAVQYGYGGFSIPINPFFSPGLLAFIKHYRGVLAVPNIRGGSEYGEDKWHLPGTKERKQNVFDDFLAATQYLVDNKVSGRGRVVLSGGSNGGLLVAACVNQAEEGLLGAGVAEVGVLDMLKFHKFTIGYAWISDYGNPDEPEGFDYIYPYSPLHNINPNKVYPPTLLLTADHDDRVSPLHTFKHAAALQHTLPNNPHPLLTRIDTKAGHGAGKSTQQRIQEAAEKYMFVARALNLKWSD